MINKEGVTHTKEEIDQYASISNALDLAIEDQKKLTNANAELTKGYSELAMHTTIGASPKSVAADTIHPKNMTIEDALKQFCSENNIK